MTNSVNSPLIDFMTDEVNVSKNRRYNVEPISLVVNSLADVVDANDGVTTLREAIAFANSQSGVNNITFDLAAGSQINLTKRLAIRSDLILSGNDITISGDGTFDNFFVNNANVVFDGFTIINGRDGIGIGNNSTVVITNSLFSNNQQDGIDVNGNNSTVVIRNSSFTNNADDGIDVTGSRNWVTVTNVELSNNLGDGLDFNGNRNTVTVSSVGIVGNGEDGIEISTGSNGNRLYVSNAEISSNASDGIDINGDRNWVKIKNASLSDNGIDSPIEAGNGVKIGGANNNIALGNSSFTGNVANGVFLDTSAEDNLLTIMNGIFSGNGDEAIADQGSENTVIPIDVSIFLPIQNAGFEATILEDFTFTTAPPPGWELYNPDGLIPAVTTDESSSPGTFNPSTGNYPNDVPEGDNVGNVFLVDEVGSGRAGLSQTLDTLLAANTRYTLSVEVGNPTGDDPVPGINFEGFPGYQVELLAGGQVLAVDNNSLEIAEGTFSTSTVTYTTSATDSLLGKPLEIRLINLLQGPGIEVDFDDVQLIAQPLSITNGSTSSYRLDGGVGKPCEPLYGSSPFNLTIGGAPSLFS